MKHLTTAQVLKRMKAGDLPTLRGGYTDASVFDDGATVHGQTMHGLFKAGKIERPEGTSIYSRWKVVVK